jgi:sporulation protein YhbH
MHPNYSIARDDWSLYRKGHMDQQRHTEKVKEAIKNNLADIVSEESIIMSEGNKIIKVPIRSLEEYRFRFNFHQGKHGGQGQGNSQKGDVLGTDPKNYKGSGRGKGAGDEPGVDYYEAEITIDELAEMIFTDLSLPNLEQRSKEELTARSIRFNDVRKTGLMGNIDRKRTILANLKRNAEAGKQGIFGINTDDLRFRTWEETNEPEANAVVLAMMDVSGSMGSFEKYVARTFFFWTVRFLRTKYERVKVIFLAHHTLAKEVRKKSFLRKGKAGGQNVLQFIGWL